MRTKGECVFGSIRVDNNQECATGLDTLDDESERKWEGRVLRILHRHGELERGICMMAQ